MFLRFELLVLIAILAIGTAIGDARADALQAQVLADTRVKRADAYAFRRSTTIERTGAARRVIVEQFDPARSVPARWTLVSIDGRKPTPKQISDARKQKRAPTPSYSDIARWFGAPASRVEGPAGYVTYRFAKLPKGALKIGSSDISANVAAEALVNVKGGRPWVEHVRLTATKGFRMMLVASVKTMMVTGRYRPGPNGQPVPAETTSDMTGSLLGKSGQLRTATTFAEFRAVR